MIAQAFSLVQQIEQAYQAVRTTPKVLADTNAQLSNLLAILHDVESEPTLNTPAIYTQLGLINGTATELKQILEKMAVLQRQSALRQGLRAFIRRSEDAAKLNRVLEQLEKAKTDLLLRVNVAHVGISRRAAATEIPAPEQPPTGTLIPTTPGEKGAHVDRMPETRYLLIERNETCDEADQLNGIGGVVASGRQVTARIAENKAIERSRQRNLILKSTGLVDFV